MTRPRSRQVPSGEAVEDSSCSQPVQQGDIFERIYEETQRQSGQLDAIGKQLNQLLGVVEDFVGRFRAFIARVLQMLEDSVHV